MFDPIKGATLAGELAKAVKPGEAGKGAGMFTDVLKDSIEKVNVLQGEADKAVEGLVKGETKNVHDTMIAIEKANLSFNMMIQVRNKLLSAYEEIMRMQV